MVDNNNEVLIYEDKNGVTKINVTFADEDVWLTQNQIADIYQTSQQNINYHIKEIYKNGELPQRIRDIRSSDREMKELQSDFDLMVKSLPNKNNQNENNNKC